MTEEAKKFLELLRYIGEKNIYKRGKPPHIDTFGDLYIEDMFAKAADMIESLSAQLEQTENKLSELLSYATGGRFSKADYSIDDMRRFVDDYNQSECNECDQLEYVNNERDRLNIMLAQAQAMLETRTKERDAAVNDIEDCLHAKGEDEPECKMCNMQKPACNWECEKAKWQWRGVEVEG